MQPRRSDIVAAYPFRFHLLHLLHKLLVWHDGRQSLDRLQCALGVAHGGEVLAQGVLALLLR